MENKIREVLALGPAEIRRRLDSRAHQDVRFSHSVREDGVWGFSVEHSSPTPEMESLSKPCPSLKITPEDSSTKLKQGNPNRQNRNLPSISPPKTRSKTSTALQAQGRKGYQDSAVATLTPQTSTLDEHTQNEEERRSKRSMTTPGVGSRQAQGTRARGRGRGSGRGGGLPIAASPVAKQDEAEAADACFGTVATNGGATGGDARATRRRRGRGRGGPPAAA